MSFRQTIEACFAEEIGEGGLPRDEFDALLTRAGNAVERLGRDWRAGRSRLLAQSALTEDLAAAAPVVEDWRRRFARVYLLGTGGSTSGARALAEALPADSAAPELVILDNLDVESVAALADPAVVKQSGFLVISKSGGTDETMTQALIAAETAKNVLKEEAGTRFLMISDPGDRPLRRLAAELGARVLDHEPEIGGRFSVLSLVGMLPAALLGLDAAAVRTGAQEVLKTNLAGASPRQAPAAQAAALAVGLNLTRGVTQSVMLAYAPGLRGFSLWYRQLWAESLGKEGKGTTPIDALGPVDQHSQLQLYLDGPWDKLFTVVTLPNRGLGPRIGRELATAVGLERLAGSRVGDLVAAMQRATAETLAGRGRPVRRIELSALDPEALGALFMHFILETLIAAELFGVDPFGQPAVEEGKVLARRYLAAAGRGNGAAAEDGAGA